MLISITYVTLLKRFSTRNRKRARGEGGNRGEMGEEAKAVCLKANCVLETAVLGSSEISARGSSDYRRTRLSFEPVSRHR